MKNIAWYTRDGHLDFLIRLSIRLMERGNHISNYYVCHTKTENELVQRNYNIKPLVLGDYIQSRKKNFNITEVDIRALERKYDFIPLRKLLWGEMYEKKFSEEKLIFHLVTHIEFWEKFLCDNNIEGIVSERPSTLSTAVLWMLCKRYGVKFLDFINVGVDERILFTSAWDGSIDGFEDKFKTIIIEKESEVYARSIQYLEKVKTQPEKPKYISRNLFTGKKTTGSRLYHSIPSLKKILTLPRHIRSLFDDSPYYISQTLAERISLIILHEMRILLHKFINVFDKCSPPSGEKYFLFPLNANNEWSAYQYLGLNYPNFISVLERISSCLPLGFKLYVKEHPSGFPDRSMSVYHHIKKFRNVRLIGAQENIFQLEKNSEGIITLGGTSGWEAFLLGKPVVVLGEPWYNFLPGIYTSHKDEELVKLLQDIRNLPIAKDEEKIKAIYCLYQISFEATRYPVVDLIAPENVEKYAQVFEHWLQNGIDWIDYMNTKHNTLKS
ncbi:MAG: hypothetical protein O3B47_05770 [bacterium]|nr:hypothetical protein [bacterium]